MTLVIFYHGKSAGSAGNASGIRDNYPLFQSFIYKLGSNTRNHDNCGTKPPHGGKISHGSLCLNVSWSFQSAPAFSDGGTAIRQVNDNGKVIRPVARTRLQLNRHAVNPPLLRNRILCKTKCYIYCETCGILLSTRGSRFK